jgi:hypothetical protein
MKKIRISAMVILAVFLCLLIGFVGPAILIPSGDQDYSGEERVFAQFALKQTRLWLAESFSGRYTPAFRVSSVIKISDNPDFNCAYEPFSVSSEYVAHVRLYTWFGVPYGEFIIDCQGHIEYQK